MTTELDRLFEIYRDFGNMDSDFISLKSQIESKLQQADSVKDFCEMLGLKEAYGYNPREVMQRAHEYVKKEHEELSQLRPIVQKIQNQIQNLKEHKRIGYRANPDCYEWGIGLLESILDSKSESKDGN